MPGFGEFLGKSGEAAWQLFVWQIAGQIVSAALTPYFTELTYLVNENHPDIVLPVNDLVTGVVQGHIAEADAQADAAKLGIDGARFTHLLEIARPKLSVADLGQLVVRGFMDKATATTEAGLTGFDPHRFDLITKISADAPGPGDLAVAFRRGLIAEDSADPNTPSFAGGIREGRLSNIWIDMFRGLAEQWPSPTDALQAELEGQLSHEEALATYKLLGGAERFYPWLFNTRGTAPTPDQGLDLVRRGVIPIEGTGPDALSLHQIFLEGPQRPKWFEPFKALLPYITPPRSVVAMIHAGILSDAQAATMLAKSGLPPEEIATYIAEGHSRASATDRNLTQATIVQLYADRIINATDTHNLLTALGYSDNNATFLVELADLRRAAAAATAAVARVHNLYVAHKINRDTAVTTLGKLKVPADQIDELIHIWELEEAVNIKQLTPAQIADAYKNSFISQGEATGELEALGYTAFDAWVLLSNHMKAAQADKPARGPNPLGVIP